MSPDPKLAGLFRKIQRCHRLGRKNKCVDTGAPVPRKNEKLLFVRGEIFQCPDIFKYLIRQISVLIARKLIWRMEYKKN